MLEELSTRIRESRTKEQANHLLFSFSVENAYWCCQHWDEWKSEEDKLNRYIWARWN